MKIFKGKVVGVGVKTATVEVERIFAHPLYVRRVRRSKRYHVHDEIGVEEGERVSFVECKPMSKTKKWKILEKVVAGSAGKKSRKGSLVAPPAKPLVTLGKATGGKQKR